VAERWPIETRSFTVGRVPFPRAALAAVAVPVLLAATCGCSGDGDAAATAAAPPSAGLPAGGTGIPGLPGDEALSPPPPDPAADDHRALLGGLPSGALAGTVELTVSGLVGFAEPVTGRCLTGETDPVLEVDLSDGSVLRMEAGSDGVHGALRAPGVEARHTLADVRLAAGPPAVMSGRLLTDGTTEPAGSLHLEFTCG
jgi:hypothetical protein